MMETLVIHCQLPLESDLPIHGSISCPDVTDDEPIDIVVDPLIIPAATISLFDDVSIEFITAGFDALPDADQSLELLVEKYVCFSNEKRSSVVVLDSSKFDEVDINKTDENNSTITTRLNDLAVRMARTVLTVLQEGHETFPSSLSNITQC